MAVITPTISEIKAYEENTRVVSWANIANGDTCTDVELPGFNIRSIQFAGTFGGATIVLQGSNDSTNYSTLTNGRGTAISKTAAAFEDVHQVSRLTRPSISGGAGSTITATLLCVRRGR